jgi:hypothetical protein
MNSNKNQFLKAIAERALKTFIQTFAAVSASANLFNGASTIDMLGVAGSAALMSILTSVVSMQFGSNGPSLAGEQIVPDQVAGH